MKSYKNKSFNYFMKLFNQLTIRINFLKIKIKLIDFILYYLYKFLKI